MLTKPLIESKTWIVWSLVVVGCKVSLTCIRVQIQNKGKKRMYLDSVQCVVICPFYLNKSGSIGELANGSTLNDECPCSWNNLFEKCSESLHCICIIWNWTGVNSILFRFIYSSAQCWPMAIRNVNISIWLNICVCGSLKAAHMWNLKKKHTYKKTNERARKRTSQRMMDGISTYYGARFLCVNFWFVN